MEYNTKSAIRYLNQKWNPLGVTVTPDKFYHALARSDVEVKRVPAGSTHRNHYKQEQLDKLHFMSATHGVSKPSYELKRVNSSEDLMQIEKKYGPLVDEDGLIEILKNDYGVTYTRHDIRIRIRRGSLGAAGYSLKGRMKIFWFPVEQFKKMRFYRRKLH